MTTRILPSEEWNRLVETDFGPVLGRLNPAGVTIIVAENERLEIIGCWSLITFAHVEGLWVHPDHRKRGRVLVRLWEKMRALAMSRSIDVVYTGALDGEVKRLLESRQAEPLPPMYALPLTSLRVM